MNDRAIHVFKYRGNRTFRAGELTVGGYMLSLRDFDSFVERALTEFNAERPELDAPRLKAFLDVLFAKGDDLRIFGKNSKAAGSGDFHIVLGMFMRTLNQGWLDVCAMPMAEFRKMLEDIEPIMDPSKYDPNRKDPTPDRAKLRKEFGGKTTVTN